MTRQSRYCNYHTSTERNNDAYDCSAGDSDKHEPTRNNQRPIKKQKIRVTPDRKRNLLALVKEDRDYFLSQKKLLNFPGMTLPKLGYFKLNKPRFFY